MTSPLLNSDSITARRLKYLEMIQAIITRMASNSFLIKAWNLTLISAIFAFSEKISQVFVASYIPVVVFWLLDAYYLSQERSFRNLWNAKRGEQDDASTDFNLDTAGYESSWIKAIFSKTLLIFHGGLLLLLLATHYLKPV